MGFKNSVSKSRKAIFLSDATATLPTLSYLPKVRDNSSELPCSYNVTV